MSDTTGRTNFQTKTPYGSTRSPQNRQTHQSGWRGSTMFKCRYKNIPTSEWETGELRLNTHAIAEVLTGDDSVFFSDLEVNINETGWQSLHNAIKSKLLLEDNYSTFLAEPKDDIERERGWI